MSMRDASYPATMGAVADGRTRARSRDFRRRAVSPVQFMIEATGEILESPELFRSKTCVQPPPCSIAGDPKCTQNFPRRTNNVRPECSKMTERLRLLEQLAIDGKLVLIGSTSAVKTGRQSPIVHCDMKRTAADRFQLLFRDDERFNACLSNLVRTHSDAFYDRPTSPRDKPMSNDPIVAARPLSGPRFGIAALMWSTLAIALALGYLRQFQSLALIATGGTVVIAAVFAGLVIGGPARRIADAMYWAAVVSTAAFLSVAGEAAVPNAFQFAWAFVGVGCGAVGGIFERKRLARRAAWCAIAGGSVMLAFVATSITHDVEALFDLVCAPVVGALVAVLIELILWIEEHHRLPRYITASWLLCAVIAGNLMVPLLV